MSAMLTAILASQALAEEAQQPDEYRFLIPKELVEMILANEYPGTRITPDREPTGGIRREDSTHANYIATKDNETLHIMLRFPIMVDLDGDGRKEIMLCVSDDCRSKEYLLSQRLVIYRATDSGLEKCLRLTFEPALGVTGHIEEVIVKALLGNDQLFIGVLYKDSGAGKHGGVAEEVLHLYEPRQPFREVLRLRTESREWRDEQQNLRGTTYRFEDTDRDGVNELICEYLEGRYKRGSVDKGLEKKGQATFKFDTTKRQFVEVSREGEIREDDVKTQFPVEDADDE